MMCRSGILASNGGPSSQPESAYAQLTAAGLALTLTDAQPIWASQEVIAMASAATKIKKFSSPRIEPVLVDVAPVRGHRSFRSAFEEALQVTDVGIPPREIRLRWNQSSDSYTWSIRY